MPTPCNPQQDIENLICEVTDAFESMIPPHPLRNYFARLLFSPKKRLDSAARLIKKSAVDYVNTEGYSRFADAYKKMMDVLHSLNSPPFNVDAMDEIIDIINCLNRAGILSDAQKQEALRARHALDNVSIEETYEDDSGGMSGSDPCPPTTYTVTRTPAGLDF